MLSIRFHGLCGLQLTENAGLGLMPRGARPGHTAILSARGEDLFRKEGERPQCTWNPDGITLDSDGKQLLFWRLTAPDHSDGARLTLTATEPRGARTPAPDALPRISLHSAHHGSLVTVDGSRLGPGASIALPAGSASGQPPKEKYNLLDADGNEKQSGPFAGISTWASATDAALWQLTHQSDGSKYLRFADGATVSVSNTMPTFDEHDPAAHFDEVYELLVVGFVPTPVPKASRFQLKAVEERSVEEGVNCVPPSDFP